MSHEEAHKWRCAPPETTVMAFHRSIPGYAPTRLVEAPPLARELEVGRVFVKEERERFGLPAFKVLGVSWAVAQVVRASAAVPAPDAPVEGVASAAAAAEDAGSSVAAGGDAWRGWEGVVAAARTLDLTVVTATDGNHGRALAALASRLGLGCRVWVPAVMTEGLAAAIAAEGAEVVRHDGTYDQTVSMAAADADRDAHAVLVQDTAWAGYEQVPSWIVAGYSTLVAEVDEQVAAAGTAPASIDLTVVPAGVGSLAQAVVTWNRSRQSAPADDGGTGGPAEPDRHRRAVLAAEPETAGCVVASMAAGARVRVPTAATVMAGLNCGTPSSLAWPVLSRGLDAAVTVVDDAATDAVDDLAAIGIDAGPSGAAALAGARAALVGPDASDRRDALGIRDDAVVVLLCTEGRAGAGA